jgi:hypothetical protein
MKYCVIMVLLASMLFGQILYEEHFTGGAMQLDWHPWFYDSLGIGDSMHVLSDPTTPGGDGWVGVISDEYMGVSGNTYAGTSNMQDYSIEAWIYTVVMPSAGPYNGITMRCNEDSGFFYRLVSDFDDSGRLRLGIYTGSMFPVTIRDWYAGEIPGGLPAISSWHKFKLKMIADSIWAYYDDMLLPDCPFINDTIPEGYFGVYTFNMSVVDSTKCDDIIVMAEGTGIAEFGIETPGLITVQPNPFTHVTGIRYHVPDNRKDIGLKIYDASGRLVMDFGRSPVIGEQSSVRWDGCDTAGNSLAPGVYFISDDTGERMAKVIKID